MTRVSYGVVVLSIDTMYAEPLIPGPSIALNSTIDPESSTSAMFESSVT